MITDTDNGPYGVIEENKVEGLGLSASEVHRLVQQKKPSGYRKWRKVIDGADHESSGKLVPVQDGADIHIETHNGNLIEGLFINSTPIEEKENPKDYIDLSQLRSKHNNSRQDIIPDSVSPKPRSLVDQEDFNKTIENVVKIDKADVVEHHEETESLTQELIELQKRSLNNLLSFDNSSAFLEAFARDGLRLKSDIELEDSPLHFLSNLGSIEVIAKYVQESTLPDYVKEHFLIRTTEYFLERSSIDCNTARNQKYLRHHKTNMQGQVSDDDSNAAGTYKSRK